MNFGVTTETVTPCKKLPKSIRRCIMRNYETMLVFRPDIEDEKREALVDRFKGIVTEAGEDFQIDNWGLRKLAYLIDDYPEGYYVVLNYKSEPTAIAELNRVAKISDELLRYMTILIED